MLQKEIVQKNIKSTLAHIERVRNNCLILANFLIEKGDFHTAIELISNSLTHDVSKFADYYEREFFIFGDESHKKELIERHRLQNLHHPESWAGVQEIRDVFVMEMASDLKARSEEKGTDLRKWIDEEFTVRHNFKVGDRFHQKLMSYIDILCEPPFERI